MALPSLEALPVTSSNSGNKDFFFTKFEEGETTIRVLSEVVEFFRYWSTQQTAPKHLNRKDGEQAILNNPPDNQHYTESDIQRLKSWGRKESQLPKVGEPKPIEYCWGFIGFNYSTGKLHCFQLTQQTLLQSLSKVETTFMKAFGDLQNYDVTVTKINTAYTALGIPDNTPFDFSLVPSDQEYEKLDIHKLIFGVSSKPEEPTPPITQEAPTTVPSKFIATVQNKLAVITAKPVSERLELFDKLENWATDQLAKSKTDSDEYETAMALIIGAKLPASDAADDEAEIDTDDIPF